MRWRFAVSVVVGECTAYLMSTKEQYWYAAAHVPWVNSVDNREKHGPPWSHTKLEWEEKEKEKGKADGLNW